MLRLVLSETVKVKGKPTRRLRLVAERCVTAAEKGDIGAIKEIADRLDGKPHATVSTTINYPLLEQDVPEPTV